MREPGVLARVTYYVWMLRASAVIQWQCSATQVARANKLFRATLKWDKYSNCNWQPVKSLPQRIEGVIVPISQGPHSDILMTGGGSTEVHILYPKHPSFRICLPKNFSTLFSTPPPPPKSHISSKLRLCYCWFSHDPKSPRVFPRLNLKIQPFGQNFRPKKILRIQPPSSQSVKYVGASSPGPIS